MTPSLVGPPTSGPETSNDTALDEDPLLLSRAALTRARLKVGDRIDVTANGHIVPLRVAGTLPAADAAALVGVMDSAAAQWRFARLGKIDRVDLALSDRPVAEAAPGALFPADETSR